MKASEGLAITTWGFPGNKFGNTEFSGLSRNTGAKRGEEYTAGKRVICMAMLVFLAHCMYDKNFKV